MNIRSLISAAAGVVALGALALPAHAGTLRWSGEVDDTATIRISGNDVRTDANMHGVKNERHTLRGSLPNRPVRVDLRNDRGRGDIQIIERPNARNNYTTVIRIKDYQAGRDRYAFTLDWPDNRRDNDNRRDDRWDNDRRDNNGRWNNGNRPGNRW